MLRRDRFKCKRESFWYGAKNIYIFFYKWCYRFVLVEFSLAAPTAIVDNVKKKTIVRVKGITALRY